MKFESSINPPEYDPNLLLDALLQKYELKNDASLARFLELNPAVISRLRLRRFQISGGVMIRLHEATGMSLAELRALMGDKRPYCTLTKKKPDLE